MAVRIAVRWLRGSRGTALVGDEVEFFLNGTYVATSIAEQSAEGSATPFFDPGSLAETMNPGDEVKLALADGSRVEIHVVRDIGISDVDVIGDTVAGIAQPGSEALRRVLGVGFCGATCSSGLCITGPKRRGSVADRGRVGRGPSAGRGWATTQNRGGEDAGKAAQTSKAASLGG